MTVTEAVDLFGTSPVTIDTAGIQHLLATVAQGARERERDDVAPFDVIDAFKRARFGAIVLPVERGGGGTSVRQLLEIVIRLAEIDPNVAHIVRNHFTYAVTLARRPPDEADARWEKEVLAGSLFGGAYSEASANEAGRDVHTTTFTADGDGYRINGSKYYSTGNLYADWLSVRGAGPDGEAISAVVPATRDGVVHADDWDGIGQRLTGSGTTHFRDVRVEADEVVPGAFGTGSGPEYSATLAQLFLTAIVAGILRAVVVDATALVRARKRTYYHAPAAVLLDDPILQLVVGKLSADAYAAEVLVLDAASAIDRTEEALRRGDPTTAASLAAALAAAKAKLVVDELAFRATTAVFDVGGASATTRRADLDRHWRNVRTLASHNPDLYKARSIGQYELSGTPLPDGAFF